MGGLARRAGVIDRFRGPDHGLLVLDGGDALLTVPRHAEVTEPEQSRAAVMLRGLGLLGTDGLALGEAELSLEGGALAQQASRNGVPLLGANLEDRRGRLVFLPRRLVQTGGVRVGVFALFEETQGSKAAEARGLRVRDAVESARVEVAALRREGAELVVMLAHLGMPRAREVASAVEGIHLGLVAHTGWRTNEPESVSGRTFLVEAGRRGQSLAHLEVRLGGGWRPELSLVDDSRRHVLYLEARRELQQVRKVLAAPMNAQVWRDRVEPQAERARLLAKQLSAAKPPVARHTLAARLVELDENVPEQAAMKAMLSSALGPSRAAVHRVQPSKSILPALQALRRRARR